MSDEPSLNHDSIRFLRKDEIALLRALLENHSSGKLLLVDLEQVGVKDMRDGGMGSIEFAGSFGGRRMSQCIAEADYVDSDGVSVSISVNVYQNGHLLEIDIWKVDFGSLIKYPAPRTIRNVRHFPL